MDADFDDKVLDNLDRELQIEREEEERKIKERLASKSVLLNQMKERENQRNESRQEYLRDRQLVDEVVHKIVQEDLNSFQEAERKKQLARKHMFEAYEEKEKLRKENAERDRLQKEEERRYLENLAKRENEQKKIKQEKEEKKNSILAKISEDQERIRKEKEFFEEVRNELYVEEQNRKDRLAELEEQIKKQKQKEEMLAFKIKEAEFKELAKQKELEEEAKFKQRLLEQFRENDRIEQFNMQRRRQKELDYKRIVKF